MPVRVAAVFAFLFASVTPAVAQDLVPYTPPTAPAPIDPVGLLLRLIFMTAITLAVCGAGVLWARRIGRTKPTHPNNAGRIVHEGTLVIDRRSAIHAIRVDGQKVAVAVDATGLRSLTLISEPFDAVLAGEVAATNTANSTSTTE